MATDNISREAAIEALCKAHSPYPRRREISVRAIQEIPAADVRPVVMERWKAHGDCGVTECPVCRWSIEECVDYNFCPNCGADMRPETPKEGGNTGGE